MSKSLSQKSSISSEQDLKEMIRFNGQQLVEGIRLEMKRSPAGIEPKGTGRNFESISLKLLEWPMTDILMNASLNIITYFVLGETLTFDQPEFKRIENMITTLIKHLMTYVQGNRLTKWLFYIDLIYTYS